MRFIRTRLAGRLVIEPDVHRDGRGFFLETYHAEKYREHGIDGPFVQDNHSRSVAGTLRGLHLQRRRPQGKLVRVIEGEIFDVAVDVRRGSPTFGRWVGVTLSAENFRAVLRPAGLRARVLRRSARSRRSNTSAPTCTIRRARSASPGTIPAMGISLAAASRCYRSATGITRRWGRARDRLPLWHP